MENNIHNDFFIKTIKDKQNAVDFLSGVLPDELLSKMDLSVIDYDDTSYMLNRFKDLFSDIVIKIKIDNKNADIFILIEHKSTLPDNNALYIQILSYIYTMYENDNVNKKDFRIIIPLVFFHGTNEWDIPEEFKDLFTVNDSVKNYMMNFKLLLYETADFDEANTDKFHKGTSKNQGFPKFKNTKP